MIRSSISKVELRKAARCTGIISTRCLGSIPWATLEPKQLGVDSSPHHVPNIVNGVWQQDIKGKMFIPNPMDKDSPPLFSLADTSIAELEPFRESMRSVPKSGLHNPLKNIDRYLMYGEISRKVCIL